jgi:hypothetical protein
MDPVRFLDLAKLLKGGTASAEMCGTAIGRAYYAAFTVGVVEHRSPRLRSLCSAQGSPRCS